MVEAEASSEEEAPLPEGEEEDEALFPVAAVVDKQVQDLRLAVSIAVDQVILPRTAVSDSSRSLLGASDVVGKVIALPSAVPRPLQRDNLYPPRRPVRPHVC